VQRHWPGEREVIEEGQATTEEFVTNSDSMVGNCNLICRDFLSIMYLQGVRELIYTTTPVGVEMSERSPSEDHSRVERKC
jgi:hypothetical protein